MPKYDINVSVEDVSVEAIFNWLGGVEGAKRCLRGERKLVDVKPKWTDNGDATITFALPPTEGLTGPEIIERLGENNLSAWAKEVLNSEDFTPAEPGVVHQVTVLKGALWSSNNVRTNENIRAEAKRRELPDLPAEAAYLITRTFSKKEIREMGLDWIVPMHEPIEDSDGDPRVLVVVGNDSLPSLSVGSGRPGDGWYAGRGFAFGSRK